MTQNSRFKRLHGLANIVGIAFGAGSFQSFGRIDHGLVMRTHGGVGGFTHCRFARKRLVNRLAESVPEFLFVFAVEHDRMRFFLPAQLQGFDSIDTQSGRSTELLRLSNQGLATCQAGFLCGFQGRVGVMDDCFPQGVQLSIHFFAQMTAIAPALGKVVQLTRHGFPIGALAVFCSPNFDFFDERQALCFVGSGLRTRFFQPHVHHLVCAGASGIKTLPQGGVGRGEFVDFFPLFAQIAQGFLKLATAHGRHEFWLRLTCLLRHGLC